MSASPPPNPSPDPTATDAPGGGGSPGSPTRSRAAEFPPYPPYATEPAPATVAEAIVRGREVRRELKSIPPISVQPLPRPAKPRGPKATDVKLTKRAMRAHSRCLRRHGAVLSDRLEQMSRPPRRSIIYLWREYAHTLAPDTIGRLRCFLDADEPFKPDQAYEYFINVKKARRKNTSARAKQAKKDMQAMCGDKRFAWARNATVAFARGIQQRLAKPGSYNLTGGMLRLSDIVLKELCCYMNVRVPSRCCNYPKERFMLEIADKLAIWVDEILTESEDRMLMMDHDEDDDVLGIDRRGGDGFDDSYKKGGGGGGPKNLLGPQPAYLRFTGKMLEAFKILTEAMSKKGDTGLLSHGKFHQTYQQGADELKRTPDFDAPDFNLTLSTKLETDLQDTAKPTTPADIEPHMKDMVDICSKYLSQLAEYNKDKGPAFKLLVQTMKKTPAKELYTKGKVNRNFGQAAVELEKSKGLETDHDDPNLSQEIHSLLSKAVASVTPPELKADMEDTLDLSSKYLSQAAVDALERGPAFDLLIQELEKSGDADFAPNHSSLEKNYSTAYVLKSAPGLTTANPDTTTSPFFINTLHKYIDEFTPEYLKEEMEEVVERCGNYLSAFVRDREKAMKILLDMLRKNGAKELAKRNSHEMSYGTAGTEIQTAPTLVPVAPVKDISDEAKKKMAEDVASSTPEELKKAMQSLVQDASRYLSQLVTLRSGVAGKRYPLNFLAGVKSTFGQRPLYKLKSYGQTYGDASHTLKTSGPLESHPEGLPVEQLIKAEWDQGMPLRLAPTVMANLNATMDDSAKHLAKFGFEKGKAMDHLIKSMKDKDTDELGVLQGYKQSYGDGARRLEAASSLRNDKVDKTAYQNVKDKLDTVVQQNPAPEFDEHMPALTDDAAKYLSSPFPESESERRQVLADMLVSKGDAQLGEQGAYKMSHRDGGEEIRNIREGVNAPNAGKKQEMLNKVNAAIPDERLKDLLKPTAEQASDQLAGVLHGRGEAMDALVKGLESDKDKTLVSGPGGKQNQGAAAEMLKSADNYNVNTLPDQDMLGQVKRGLSDVPKVGASSLALRLMDVTANPAKPDSGDDEERRRREAELRAIEEARLRALAAEAQIAHERERLAAQDILHRKLRGKGDEELYKQPHLSMSHVQGSDWLRKSPLSPDKSVKESLDTARLSKKLERRLSVLVNNDTPLNLADAMQDVLIESSRTLSEIFVAQNFKSLVKEALVAEMQKKGNEILHDHSVSAETFFFAAQRIKRSKDLDAKSPRSEISHGIAKRLEDMIKCRTMPRKLFFAMKDHIKEVADFLSTQVDKPDDYIEAYVALLVEMENAGDTLLIEGDIPKSYEDSAAYLRQLLTFEDRLHRSNSTLKSAISSRLQALMANQPSNEKAYNPNTMKTVIEDQTNLLVSYIVYQGLLTDVIKFLVKLMDEHGESILLRHGTMRKTFKEAHDLLMDKNADQLRVQNVDPVVKRKVQIKIDNLILRNEKHIPSTIRPNLEAGLETAISYLAVHLIKPEIIKVCRCMKSVFVQCELWCDEILRRVTRPCCGCAQHTSPSAFASSPRSMRVPGAMVSVSQCPSKYCKTGQQTEQHEANCPAARPHSAFTANTYMMYSPLHMNYYSSEDKADSSSVTQNSEDSMHSFLAELNPERDSGSLDRDEDQEMYRPERDRSNQMSTTTPDSYYTAQESTTQGSSDRKQSEYPYWKTHITHCAKVESATTSAEIASAEQSSIPKKTSARKGYSSKAPIVTTYEMSDWYALMVSLVWNVQGWKCWIQENIDRALHYAPKSGDTLCDDSWLVFKKKLFTEILQWRLYNSFSRQLTARLALRYRDNQVLSSNKTSIKTQEYMDCQQEMLDIIEMFNKWTQLLSVIVKEADALKSLDPNQSSGDVRWNHFKSKISNYSEDWYKYKKHFKMFWEDKYKNLIRSWLPSCESRGPVWVVSACGAVPSGAVAAGLYGGEVAWVARTTHKGSVLPAALLPSKHCCWVYAEGAVHNYTKYQVMCNAEVTWLAWRSGSACNNAVRVAPGIYIGRVLYRGSHLIGPVKSPNHRCHIVIFGRPFAFNCFELLVLIPQDPTSTTP